jgi:hypothetical protein
VLSSAAGGQLQSQHGKQMQQTEQNTKKTRQGKSNKNKYNNNKINNNLLTQV